MGNGLPEYLHERVAQLALALFAGLANAKLGKAAYGVRLVSRRDDLFRGFDAVWIYPGRRGRRCFHRLDFTTGGRRTFLKKIRRSVRKRKGGGKGVQIERFAPGTNVSLGADPCFREAYEALTANAKVGRGGTTLYTTMPCPEHGDRCALFEGLLFLGGELHTALPKWTQIPEEMFREIMREGLRKR